MIDDCSRWHGKYTHAFIHISLVSTVLCLTLLQEKLEYEFAGIFHINSLGSLVGRYPGQLLYLSCLQF